jgi:hypothetical protein
MPITQAVCNSFKQELGVATHNFTTSTGHTFRIALYTSAATLGAATTVYSSTNEVANGSGYTTGGVTLVNVTPTLSGATAIFDFGDAQWTNATFTARGALIYNTSQANRAVLVLDFGTDQTVTNGTFTVQFPTPDAASALLRLA